MKLQNSNFLQVKYYYSIYFMHNNSLRRQIAWQNRQQSRIFRKSTRFAPEDSPVPASHSSNTIIRVSNDCNQHSELKWLEKVVFDMKRYKIDPKQEQHSKQNINHSISYGITKNVLEDKSNVVNEKNKNNQSVSQQKIQKRGEGVEAENKKSGKKIKFQIISNKQNKVTSARKSSSKIPEAGQRSVKKISQSSSKSHLKATKKVTDYISCEPPQVHSGVHQVTVSPCLTEELSNIQIKEDTKCLWDDRQYRNQSFTGLNRSYDDRKSAGKIIKNHNQRLQSVKSQSLSSTFANKNKDIEVGSSKKQQKVYLKLETENLSKYLGESQIKEDSVPLRQEPLQQNNLYTTKKQVYIEGKPFEFINIRCQELGNYSTNQKLEKDYKNSCVRTQLNQWLNNREKIIVEQNYKERILFKPQRFQETDENDVPYIRTKSQQRKLNQRSLNKNAQLITVPLLDITSDHICYDSKKTPPTAQLKYKKYKDVQQKQIQAKNITIEKSQKLFTLYSEGEDTKIQKQSQVQANQSLQALSKCIDPSCQSLHKKIQIEEVICTSIDVLQPKEDLKLKKVPSFSNQEAKQSLNNQRELKLLFNFLDHSKRRLLTSSNCRVEGLTEELKLMFSSIINQIKTKKKTYTLQKFISQSKSVMEVKKEVYSSNQSQTKANIINQILKENIQILKKKSPLELITQTHTKSIFETNQNSKRSSYTDNSSIVIAKLMVKEDQTANESSQLKKQSFRGFSNSIDLEEPQNYFKRKYGIVDSNTGILFSNNQATFQSAKQTNLQDVDIL